MERKRNEGIGMITEDSEFYPELLRMIKGRPKRLYYSGNLELLKTRCVSVVGSRTTTAYGRNTAKAIGAFLGRSGMTVVSGMAAGIDSCAHEGALGVEGNTIAVLGCGPDICYPKENLSLMQRIKRKGLIISESGPGTEPMPYSFPQRNRIISGLSELTVVIQARNRSGALITAELAAEQGREICAVPGNIDSQYNLGTNKLILEGATPLIRVDDLRDILGIGTEKAEVAFANLTPLERRIYEALNEGGEMSADELCIGLEDTPQRIAPALSVLEIKGILCSASGKFFLANG